jgi:DNA-binding NarL/FixJ family response regulator
MKVPHATPTLDDPDPVAVERIAAGQRPARYTAGEMRVAVELLTARGMSGRQIAVRIGCTRRTVQRYRRLVCRIGLPAEMLSKKGKGS